MKRLRAVYIHSVVANADDLFVNYQIAYLLLGEGGRTAAETIGPLFCNTLIRFYKVSEHICLGRRDYTRVNVGPRTKIIENTSRDSGVDDIEGLLSLFY